MPHDYTLRQAQELLATDNKTLQRWMLEAQIVPRTDPKHHSKKLLSRQQLEALAHAHGRALPPEQPEQPNEHLAALEARLRRQEAQLTALRTDMEARIARLEEQVEEVRSQNTALSDPGQKRGAPALARSTASRSTVPWRRFVEDHGIEAGRARQTLTLHGDTLDQAGRAAFYRRWHDKPGFQPCAACPHEPAPPKDP